MSDFELQPLPELSRYSAIEPDFETDGLKWYAGSKPIGLAYKLPETGERGYIPFGHLVGPNHDPATVRDWMAREFRGKHLTNAKIGFDAHMSRVLGADWTELDCTFEDVLHNAALLDDNQRKINLDSVARAYGLAGKLTEVQGVTLDKTKMASYPASIVAPYALQDVEIVDELRQITHRKLAEEDLLRVWQLENDVIPAVVEMEKNGAPIDQDTNAQWIDETARELETTLHQIYRNTGIRFGTAQESLFPGGTKADPKFEADLVRRLFKSRGIAIPQKLNDENELVNSVEDDLLAAIDDPSIQLFRYGKQLTSLRSKFLLKYPKILRADGCVGYNLHQLAADDVGTVSGRFSSSGKDAEKRDMGINIQQQFSIDNQLLSLVAPWLVRRLFVPKAGRWVSADQDQVEYRFFAHFANSPKINAVYAANPRADFHITVMELLQTVIDINRKHTKNVNFAMVFGAGEGKFAEMCGLVAGYDDRGYPIPNDRARQLYAAYNAMFPEVKPLLRRASNIATPLDANGSCSCKYQPCYKRSIHRGYVKTALGRRARFPHGGKLHSALNRVIQGTAAEAAKRKIVQVYRNRRALEFTMRFPVHDELNGDQTPSKIPMLRELLNEQDAIDGKQTFSRIPIYWGVDDGANWACDYGKKARKEHADGRISDAMLERILR